MKLWISFLFASVLFLGNHTLAEDTKVNDSDADRASKKATSQNTTHEVVNWDIPKKRELVERALSDGMTDPARIVKWAKNYKVTMTVKEVREIKAKLKAK
jgi:hypothetical protein